MFQPEELANLPYRRGPHTAKIAFVGEAPGEHEEVDPLKRPFIGPSGQLLEKMMREVGLSPDSVYLTNVIKERPDEKEIKVWIKNHYQRYQIWLEVLRQELLSLPNLNLIVPVGLCSLEAITGRKSIDSWRGSIISSTMKDLLKKCIGIIHPAAILRNWLYRPATVVDLQRIKEEGEFPEINLPQREYRLRPTFEEVMDEISLWRSSKDLLSVDTETLPRPQRLVLFQACVSPKRAMAIPFQYKNGNSYWPEDQELLIWKNLFDLLHNCGKRIIGQNFLTFDNFMLSVSGANWEKILANIFLDTMEAAQCLQPQLPIGLDFLTSVYTREPYYKSEGKEWGTKQGEEEFWTYGCKDVMVVHEIAPQLYQELEEEKQLDFYYKRFQGLAKERMKMSRRGLLIDEEKRLLLEKEFQQKIVIEQCKLNVLAGENLNVKSPKMRDFLYGKMKLPTQWKDGKVTCDEDALLTLSAKYPGEVFKHILTIRHLRTLFSNNIKARKDSDGRIRCSFGFAETGRFRSYSCPLGSGGNLQNWTPPMRVMVVPEKGKVLLEGDASQAEARVVAWAGRIPFMLDAFRTGKDVHKVNASLVFELPYDAISKKSVERYAAKQLVHAADYDVHAPTFAKAYNKKATEAGYPITDIRTAQLWLNKYHERVPELKQNYHKWIEEQLSTTKTLVNPFGRIIRFHERVGPDLYRQGYADFAQSTVADMINTILMAISDSFDILLQVHDSILIQCSPHEVKGVVEAMNSVNPIIMVRGEPLQIPLEFKWSDKNWYEMTDYVQDAVAA